MPFNSVTIAVQLCLQLLLYPAIWRLFLVLRKLWLLRLFLTKCWSWNLPNLWLSRVKLRWCNIILRHPTSEPHLSPETNLTPILTAPYVTLSYLLAFSITQQKYGQWLHILFHSLTVSRKYLLSLSGSYSKKLHEHSNKPKCNISLVFLTKRVILIVSHYLQVLNGNFNWKLAPIYLILIQQHLKKVFVVFNNFAWMNKTTLRQWYLIASRW